MQWAQLVVSVTGGVTVATILSIARATWARRRMPKALSQAVKRRQYLSEVHAIAKEPGVERLDALVPNLTPAATSPNLAAIQETWQEINKRERARVVTREEEHCLIAAAELLSRGIETRIARKLISNDLSFHLFRGALQRTVIRAKGATAWVFAPPSHAWYRAAAPGPPGTEERRFYLVRATGTLGVIDSVWSWDDAVLEACRDVEEIIVRLRTGATERHRHDVVQRPYVRATCDGYQAVGISVYGKDQR